MDITPRISAQDYIALKARKGNKYGAQSQVTPGGIKCDSMAEAALGLELEIRVKAGELAELHHHEGIEILPGFLWRVDFSAINAATGLREYFEFKGVEGHGYRLQIAAWKHLGPGILHIYKGSHLGYSLAKTVTPDLQLFKDWLAVSR